MNAKKFIKKFHENTRISKNPAGESPLLNWKPGDLLTVYAEVEHISYTTIDRYGAIGRINHGDVMMFICHSPERAKLSHRWSLVLMGTGLVYIDPYQVVRC